MLLYHNTDIFFAMPKVKQDPPALSWAATIWPRPDPPWSLEEILVDLQKHADLIQAGTHDHLKYLLVGDEEGKLTGGRHFQCCFQLKTKQRWSPVKTMFGIDHANIQKARKWQSLVRYCKKDCKILIEAGSSLGMGERTDIARWVEAIDSGMTQYQLKKEFPDQFVKYHKSIETCKMADMLNDPGATEPRPMKGTWFWGPSGNGKSYAAWEIDHKRYRCAPPTYAGGALWFTGYEGQKTLFFDECPPSIFMLLQLTDPYPIEVQTRQGKVPGLWNHVVVCTMQNPFEMYSGDQWMAVSRRFHIIKKEHWKNK